jgi:hypothetical protein
MTDYKHNAKMHLIETENKEAFIFKSDKLYSGYGEKTDRQQCFNLYVTSNEEIKEGDWCLLNVEGTLRAVRVIDITLVELWNIMKVPKIIAATNTSLLTSEIKNRIYKGVPTKVNVHKPLPQIPKLFIKYYIEQYNKGNVITDVLVEYEEYMTDGWVPTYNNPDNHNLDQPTELDYRLKINSDNTINIYQVKDTWNRLELIEKLNECAAFVKHKIEYESYCIGDLEEWINENV